MPAAVAQESFEHLLRKGPPNGDAASGLDELRYKILIDGIPSNSDGMVKDSTPLFLQDLNVNLRFVRIVRTTHLHLAYPAQLPAHNNRHLPRSGPAGRLARLLQNPQRHVPHPRHGPSLPAPRHREQPHPRLECHRLEAAGCARIARQRVDVAAYIERCGAEPRCVAGLDGRWHTGRQPGGR